MHNFPEEDWRRLRPLRERALARFYERTLAEAAALAAETSVAASERYHRLSKRMEERNQELASTFDDPRRSSALRQLWWMCQLKLIHDEELSGFTPETQRSLALLREL